MRTSPSDVASRAAKTPVYQALLDVAWAGDDARLRECLRANAEMTLRAAYLEGLLPDVAACIKAADTPPEWQAQIASWKLIRERLARALGVLGDSALVMKGFALEEGRRNAPRFFTDLDLLVPDVANLATLATRLRGAGFREGERFLLLRGANDTLCGAVKFVHADGTADLGDIEVQVGAYPITAGSRLLAPELTREPRLVHGPEPYLAPRTRSHIAVILAELYSRREAKIRDVIDLDLLVQRPDAPSAEEIVSFAQRHELMRSLAIVRDATAHAPDSQRMSTQLGDLLAEPAVRCASAKRSEAEHLRVHCPRSTLHHRLMHGWFLALRSALFGVRPHGMGGALAGALLDAPFVAKHVYRNGYYCFGTRISVEPAAPGIVEDGGSFIFSCVLGSYLVGVTPRAPDARRRNRALKMCPPTQRL